MTMTAATGRIPSWTVGDRLRKARESADLGVQELADELGVNRRTIGRYENNEAPPSKRHVLLYQMRTGVSADWIMTGGVHPPGLEPGTH